MFKRYQRIHFVGIGGIGMSGIAEILLTLGLCVTGSDIKRSGTTQRLVRKGAKVWIGHKASHAAGAHVVVVSSAIPGTNPEVRFAHKMGIPVVPRAEMLAELMRIKYGIAVAGTHGKTTTTSLIASIVNRAKLDPTMIIGGKVKSFRCNAKLGSGEYLVAEADESDRSFLKLSPTIGVITNIDPEHLENYNGFGHLKEAFIDFANKVPFYGSVVCCVDHPVVRKIVPRIARRVVTYGESGADYIVKDIKQSGHRLEFDVDYQGAALGKVVLPMVGRHHAKNAAAAIAVARELEIPFATIRKALKEFKGISRRFEILHNSGPMIVDDYGHHPVEIAATILAAREGWPERRIIAVIQPHRYTRLGSLFDEFVQCVRMADIVLVTEVYRAGEKPIRGVTGERLCEAIRRHYPKKAAAYTPTLNEACETLKKWSGERDLVLFLGAGDITKAARAFAREFK
jgi:UDP-N-acetylmuramate--alanine ligase